MGFVTRRTQREPPSVESAALRMIPIIRITTAAEIPNGTGSVNATRNSCTPRCYQMVPYGLRTAARVYDATSRDPLRSPRPLRRASGPAGARRLGARPARSRSRWRPASRASCAPAGSSSTTSNRPAPRRPSRPSSASRRRRSSSSSRARRSRPARPHSRPPRPRPWPTSRPRPTSPASCPHLAAAAPDLRRRAHGLRHRLPRSAARRLPRRPADPARAAPRGARASTSSWPAARRSTATSRPCRRPTSGGARSSRCRSPRSRCCSSSARSSRPGVPLIVGGAAVVVALAGIFLVGSLMPMSIFVLNLATLLGLGLGVDYSLLMTSRFREELATPADGPDAVAEAVRVTVATAGRAVFFSGLTVLLGLLGLVLFEFMILRSVGIAGAIVVGLAVALRADAAAGAARVVGDADRPVLGPARRPRGRTPTGHGPGSRGGSCASPSRCWSRRWPPAGARLAVPPRPVQRPGRLDPAAERAVARRLRPARRRSSARASSRRCARHPDGRPRDERRRTSRRSTTTRGGSRPTPASRASRASSTSTLASTSSQYQLLYARPERAARPLRRDGPRRHDQGRPDGVHGLHAVRPEPRRGPCPRRGPARPRPGRSPPPAGMTVLVGGGAADVTDVVDRVAADFPRTRCSSS